MHPILIFDLDGTLVDSKADISYCINQALIHCGLDPVDEGLIAAHVGTGILALLDTRVGTDTPEYLAVRQEFDRLYLDHLADQTRLYAGMDAVLAHFADYRKYVLTNKRQKYADLLIDHLGLRSHFVAIYGREAFAQKKPDPLPILSIAEREAVEPASCWMIGDTPIDIWAGKSAGSKTCAVLFGYGIPEQIRAQRPDLIASAPAQIMHLDPHRIRS